MEDSRLMQSMLLDFYGELLTDKQREYCELHFNEDLSLSEIAEQCGISRQGVWDNIRRAVSSLEQIEEKTGLIRRFSETRGALGELSAKAERLLAMPLGGEARVLAGEIAEGIETLKEKG